MSWRTTKLAIWSRGIARKTGIAGILGRKLNKAGYETRYDKLLLANLRYGDVVWDVGANIGHYTCRFADRVGGGTVVAFEPSAKNFERLQAATHTRSNVVLLDCALGLHDGRAAFEQGSDDLGATSRVTEMSSSGTKVEIRSATSLLTEGVAPLPNVIKIDVEGLEYQVLLGCGAALENPALRVLGIEVHFGILQASGHDSVPSEIESLLVDKGFKLRWTDPSHLLATR